MVSIYILEILATCHAGAFEKIRYNKSVSINFDKEDDIESKEDLGCNYGRWF